MSMFNKGLRMSFVGKVCLIAALSLGLSVSAHAKNGKGKGKAHGHNKMSICQYKMNGTYKLKSLPVKAALKQLANNELNKEPVIGPDGAETCDEVAPPMTSCVINIDGTDYTLADFIAEQQIVVGGFNTDNNSCDLRDADGNNVFILFNNVPGFFDDGLGPRLVYTPNNRNTLIINSEAQYNDCAFDIETLTNAAGTCPAPFFP